ncbi:MAG TPA: Hpt domain-containing protein [Bdellovibrionota bacterium]|jgi:HPt (histidine-containing phosphotransfer) domain-containing protein
MGTAKKENIVEVSESTRSKYFRSLTIQIYQLRQAMEKSDYKTAREICHRVRGSASLFGLRDLGEACRDVEAACMAQDGERIVEGFQVIEVIVGRNVGTAEAS